MKKFLKIIRYPAIIALGVLFARFVLFRDNIKSIPVTQVELSNRVVEKTVSASGEVKAKKEAELSFNTAGKIQDIKVEKGDTVAKGDLLAYLDNYSAAQTAQSYKDARDVTLRDKDKYIEDYSTNLDAVGGSDEYAIALRRLDELISEAEATYQASLASLSDTYMYAPFAGTIVDVTKQMGETATIGASVVKLADLTNLIFEIVVDQEDYGLLKQNQSVKIELDAYENYTFSGFISKLPYYANGGDSANFTVEITLNSDDQHPVLLGMMGDAHIVVASTETEVPSLVYDEISFDEDDKPFVWVVRNGWLAKQPVEIGLEGDVYTQILTPIQDTIVTSVSKDTEIKEGFKAKFNHVK